MVAVMTVASISYISFNSIFEALVVLGWRHLCFCSSLERIDVELVDINRIFIPLILTPGRFGFTNSTTPALAPLAANPNTDPNDYVFFDDFHLTN
jgi:phospholipase/lecithinase/hemolysin